MQDLINIYLHNRINTGRSSQANILIDYLILMMIAYGPIAILFTLGTVPIL